jgi:hypothetical protein
MYRFLALLLFLIGLYPSPAQSQSSRGQTKNGKPVGVWEYYDGKELGLRFDHDSSRIQFVRPDTASYLVLVDSVWKAHKLDRAPRLLGSREELLMAIGRQLRYPTIGDIANKVTGTVVLTYVIDQYGNKTTPIATTTPTLSLAEEVYRVVESIPIRYLPAVYQGKPTPVKIAFVVRFIACKTNEECQKTGNALALSVPMPPGSVGEMIVTLKTYR